MADADGAAAVGAEVGIDGDHGDLLVDPWRTAEGLPILAASHALC